MNAKTLEAVRKHGEQLLAIFPNATERDPVALCRKLRRVEAVARRYAVDHTNGDLRPFPSEDDHADNCERYLDRVRDLLGVSATFKALQFDDDGRGCVFVLDDKWTRQNVPDLYHNMGGDGVIAPDLTGAR